MRKEAKFTLYLYVTVAVVAFFGSLGFGLTYFMSERANGLLDARASFYTAQEEAILRDIDNSYDRPWASGAPAGKSRGSTWELVLIFVGITLIGLMLLRRPRKRTVEFVTTNGDVRFVKVRGEKRIATTFPLDLAEFIMQSKVRGLSRKAWNGSTGESPYRFRTGKVCSRPYYEKLVKTLLDGEWAEVSKKGTYLLGSIPEVLQAYELQSIKWN